MEIFMKRFITYAVIASLMVGNNRATTPTAILKGIVQNYAQKAQKILENPISSPEILFSNCYSQHYHITQDLSALLDHIEHNILYWKMQQYSVWKYFIIRGPIKWFTGMPQDKEVQEKIHILEQKQKIISTYLGQLHKAFEELQKDKNETLFHQYLLILYDGLASQGPQNKAYETIQDNYQLAQKTSELLKTFKSSMLKELDPYEQPGHLHRYWLTYTTLALVAGAAGYFAYHNPKYVAEKSSELPTIALNFWGKHVKKPITKIYNMLKGIDQDEQANEAKQQEIKEYNKTVENEYPNTTPGRRLGEICQHDLPNQIAQVDNRITPPLNVKVMNVEHPMLDQGTKLATKGNIYATTLPEMIKLGHYEKNDAQLRFLRMEQTLSLLLGMASTFPAYVVFKLGLSGLQKTYNALTHHNITKPLMNYCSDIERILNKNAHQETLSDESFGLILHKTNKLKDLQVYIPQEHRISFVDDIQELETIDFTIKQKLSTIRRMFRVYSFLNNNQ